MLSSESALGPSPAFSRPPSAVDFFFRFLSTFPCKRKSDVLAKKKKKKPRRGRVRAAVLNKRFASWASCQQEATPSFTSQQQQRRRRPPRCNGLLVELTCESDRAALYGSVCSTCLILFHELFSVKSVKIYEKKNVPSRKVDSVNLMNPVET